MPDKSKKPKDATKKGKSIKPIKEGWGSKFIRGLIGMPKPKKGKK